MNSTYTTLAICAQISRNILKIGGKRFARQQHYTSRGERRNPYEGKAGSEDEIICRKLDATSCTFFVFWARSASGALVGSTSYPWPGGKVAIVLIKGWIRLRKYVYPCILANAERNRVQVELLRKRLASLSI